jgi:hypothetical protein
VAPSKNNVPSILPNSSGKKTQIGRIPDVKILVYLLQSQKQVSIELLATLMPYPIQFESRRRSLQRFLKLDSLNIESLWFPLVKKYYKQSLKSLNH